MWSVFIREAAQADLRNTRDWYEKQRHGLGEVSCICNGSARQIGRFSKEISRFLSAGFPFHIFNAFFSDSAQCAAGI